MSPRRVRPRPCARCGRMIPDFEASFQGEWYCHTPPLPSCFSRTVQEWSLDLDRVFGESNA